MYNVLEFTKKSGFIYYWNNKLHNKQIQLISTVNQSFRWQSNVYIKGNDIIGWYLRNMVFNNWNVTNTLLLFKSILGTSIYSSLPLVISTLI